jgi:hypothetical protein
MIKDGIIINGREGSDEQTLLCQVSAPYRMHGLHSYAVFALHALPLRALLLRVFSLIVS